MFQCTNMMSFIRGKKTVFVEDRSLTPEMYSMHKMGKFQKAHFAHWMQFMKEKKINYLLTKQQWYSRTLCAFSIPVTSN